MTSPQHPRPPYPLFGRYIGWPARIALIAAVALGLGLIRLAQDYTTAVHVQSCREAGGLAMLGHRRHHTYYVECLDPIDHSRMKERPARWWSIPPAVQFQGEGRPAG